MKKAYDYLASKHVKNTSTSRKQVTDPPIKQKEQPVKKSIDKQISSNVTSGANSLKNSKITKANDI